MVSAKIMVVEDSPTYLRTIANFLQDLGYEVITAVDGEEALEKANDADLDDEKVKYISINLSYYT